MISGSPPRIRHSMSRCSHTAGRLCAITYLGNPLLSPGLKTSLVPMNLLELQGNEPGELVCKTRVIEVIAAELWAGLRSV
ncbi:hypothetical protein VTK73DRAFT_6213 [Phialemonium thermophilum]|uniref:Uncharacterized protein n=1 Tax=Phialemonium thermophilum TaxID=223376 RepID=A0ABR3XXA1_9PEZI